MVGKGTLLLKMINGKTNKRVGGWGGSKAQSWEISLGKKGLRGGEKKKIKKKKSGKGENGGIKKSQRGGKSCGDLKKQKNL